MKFCFIPDNINIKKLLINNIIAHFINLCLFIKWTSAPE